MTGEASPCEICGCETTFAHQHRADNSGLDDGPPLHTPRKKAAPKSAETIREIRSESMGHAARKVGQIRA